MAGIYLHIPFCKQACHYCDFHFSTNVAGKNDMVCAMTEELLLQHAYLKGERIDTVYFGGGTPSMLAAGDVDSLLESIRRTHALAADAEITMEANPDDLHPTFLRALRATGINRLSIGIQTFDDALLHYLNRAHGEGEAIRSVEQAREAGFENISIDLIYAIPGQTSAIWTRDIRQAIALAPEHISCYHLTIEKRTAFGNWFAKGKLEPVDDALAAGQLETLMGMLDQAGYDQYEISNFSKPGKASRHNSSYWEGVPYLGIGPGAHSYDGVSRQHNVRHNHRYVEALRRKQVPFETEVLTRENRINEYILTSLRTAKGCDLGRLKNLLQYDLPETQASYLAQLQKLGLAALRDNILRLSPAGRLLADKITADLFVVS